MRSERLVAVTPARNEEKFIAKCILSVSNQSYPVTMHIVVDDWSDDRTRTIAESFGRKIMVISSQLDKGTKAHGIRPHLVTDIGIKKAKELIPDWRYCLVLDGDTWLPSNYCETIITEMKKNPRLMMAGARFLRTPSGIEVAPKAHVRGGNHIIKRDLYEKSQIGYSSVYGERMLERIAWITGFETKSLPLVAFEGRPTGRTVSNPILSGVYDYKLGTPILALAFSLRHLRKSDLLELIGWIYGKLHREKRCFTENRLRILYRRYIDLLIRGSRSSL
jgi:glycosyltransferase involved in cell wall biosynthesis